jgi:hypothetical protein
MPLNPLENIVKSKKTFSLSAMQSIKPMPLSPLELPLGSFSSSFSSSSLLFFSFSSSSTSLTHPVPFSFLSSHLDNKLVEQLQLLRSDVASHTQYEEIVVLPALQSCKSKERLLELGRWWLDGKQHNFTLPLKQLLSNPTISSVATHQIPANLPIR